MGSVKPLNGKPYACASTTTTPGAYETSVFPQRQPSTAIAWSC